MCLELHCWLSIGNRGRLRVRFNNNGSGAAAGGRCGRPYVRLKDPAARLALRRYACRLGPYLLRQTVVDENFLESAGQPIAQPLMRRLPLARLLYLSPLTHPHAARLSARTRTCRCFNLVLVTPSRKPPLLRKRRADGSLTACDLDLSILPTGC